MFIMTFLLAGRYC